MNTQQSPEEIYNEFWKEILEKPDGSLNIEQVKKELADFHFVMQQVPKVYCHITGNKLSKLIYKAETVCASADEYYSSLIELKPDPDLDFVNDDKVFIEHVGEVFEYYILCYEKESCAWVLIPYTDKHFKTPKKNKEGKVVAEFVYAYGLDCLERVEDFDFDELP